MQLFFESGFPPHNQTSSNLIHASRLYMMLPYAEKDNMIQYLKSAAPFLL